MMLRVRGCPVDWQTAHAVSVCLFIICCVYPLNLTKHSNYYCMYITDQMMLVSFLLALSILFSVWASECNAAWEWRFTVPSKYSTEVPGRLLHSSLWCRQSTNIWDLPVDTSLLFRGFDEARLAVWPSLLGVRWLGTHYRTISWFDSSLCSSSFRRGLKTVLFARCLV